MFSHDLRVAAWFEELDAGPVTSVSFAYDPAVPAAPPTGKGQLRCPDFVVGTRQSLVVACTSSMFEDLSPEGRRGTLLVQGQNAAVHGLAAHPHLPRFASTGHSGLLQLWDYDEKRLLLLRMFDSLYGQCVAFSPDGALLAVGFTNGLVKVLAAATLQEMATFAEARGCVQHLAFSADGVWLAVAAADRAVAVYRYAPGASDPTIREWEVVGRHKAHSSAVVSLAFSSGVGSAARLLSCGEDRFLVEYDLSRASVQDGLPLRKATRLEQTATPSALLWLDQPTTGAPASAPGGPAGGEAPAAEPLLVAVANDAYKIRLVNVDTMVTSKTKLGPTHGGPVTHMVRLPMQPPAEGEAPAAGAGRWAGAEEVGEADAGSTRMAGGPTPAAGGYAVYSTYDKVIGLVRLPFDGNPSQGMGLIAHPGQVSSMAVTSDGAWILTAGGPDLAIHMWAVDTDTLDRAAAGGGAGAAPIERLLDGGRDGPFYSEMADYFCYAQLRAQGEDSVEERQVPGRVPAAELPNLMRALGFYPSDREIDEIVQVRQRGARGVDGGGWGE
jgi:WD40 repeat protein